MPRLASCVDLQLCKQQCGALSPSLTLLPLAFLFEQRYSFSQIHGVRRYNMKGVAFGVALAALASLASASLSIVERPMMLYSSVSPKMRIQADKAAFAG